MAYFADGCLIGYRNSARAESVLIYPPRRKCLTEIRAPSKVVLNRRLCESALQKFPVVTRAAYFRHWAEGAYRKFRWVEVRLILRIPPDCPTEIYTPSKLSLFCDSARCAINKFSPIGSALYFRHSRSGGYRKSACAEDVLISTHCRNRLTEIPNCPKPPYFDHRPGWTIQKFSGGLMRLIFDMARDCPTEIYRGFKASLIRGLVD